MTRMAVVTSAPLRELAEALAHDTQEVRVEFNHVDSHKYGRLDTITCTPGIATLHVEVCDEHDTDTYYVHPDDVTYVEIEDES